MPVRTKICGITNCEDAEAAVEAGADALGFILYEKSRRFISIGDAIRILQDLPPFVQTVAVTVNAMKEFTNLGWRKQLKNFSIAQLHGEESPTHVKAVGKYLPVIKVLPAGPRIAALVNTIPVLQQASDIAQKVRDMREKLTRSLGRQPSLDEITRELGLPSDALHPAVQLLQNPQANGQLRTGEFDAVVSAFMLDTPSAERGGTGRPFDWNLAVEFKKRITRPLILSGGLSPENVAKAIQTVQPYAVDVSSGVEAAPGRKDHTRLRDFIQICKSF